MCDKEVVSAEGGVRLGLVDDLEFNDQTAAIERLYIYGRGEMFGLGQRSDDIVIEWSDVETVGGDVILVKNMRETQGCAPRRRGLFR